ncbi:MAG: hypothetical protein AAF722_06210 [Cyanobacteria bacterium P01_C01_bin.70]
MNSKTVPRVSQITNVPTQELQLIYSECAANYRYYLDWRFKLLTRHAVAVGAALLAIKYVIDNSEIDYTFAAIPLLLLGFLSLAFLQIDRRHEDLSMSAAKIAADIERSLQSKHQLLNVISQNPGFFYYQVNNRPKIFNHSMMFRLIYLVSAVVSFLSSGLFWWLYS